MNTDRELFSADESAVLSVARDVLSLGMERVRGRLSLFPDGRKGEQQEKARQAREALTMLLQLRIGNLPHEQGCAALFDAQGRLVAIEDFPQGDLISCSMPHRMLAGFIVRHGAAQVLLAHNHPSGECRPSQADETMTISMEAWLRPMGCFLTDALVVTVDDWCAIKGNWTC